MVINIFDTNSKLWKTLPCGFQKLSEFSQRCRFKTMCIFWLNLFSHIHINTKLSTTSCEQHTKNLLCGIGSVNVANNACGCTKIETSADTWLCQTDFKTWRDVGEKKPSVLYLLKMSRLGIWTRAERFCDPTRLRKLRLQGLSVQEQVGLLA